MDTVSEEQMMQVVVEHNSSKSFVSMFVKGSMLVRPISRTEGTGADCGGGRAGGHY